MSALAFMSGRLGVDDPSVPVPKPEDVELVRRAVPALDRLRAAAERSREYEAAYSFGEAARWLRIVQGQED